MAWVRVIPPEEATGILKEKYASVTASRGKVANVVSISSLLPDVMAKGIDFYLALMFGPHKLSRELREMVAVEVSRANDCRYCMEHHGAALARVVRDEAKARAFVDRGVWASEGPRERAARAYARKLTLEPGKISKSDVDALRNAGFDDEEIVAINHVVGYFNMMNRFVNGLGVVLESDKGADAAYKY